MKSLVSMIKKEFPSIAASVGIFVIIAALVAALLFGIMCLSGWLFKVIWNFLDSTLLHWQPVTFWQAFAIMALLSMIGQLFRSTGDSK